MGHASQPIYCDHQATTPLAPEVLEAMLPYFGEQFGNPSSQTHVYGWTAAAAVETAREAIATAINAEPTELVFTSGATEANNLAIKGVAEAYLQQGRHLVTVASEHRAALDPVQYLGQLGFEVTILPVQPNGLLNLETLAESLRSDTILVSVMAANNEIGVLQPIADIGQLLRDKASAIGHKPLFHTDAAQALGKIPLDVEALGVDLMSITAHKIYGPKGVGALYVRRRDPRVKLAPQLHGGGQERDRRSGTLNPPLIVGFAKAVELALAQMAAEQERLRQLRDRLWEILSTLDNITLNGALEPRLADNLNASFAGVNSSALLLGVREVVALSSGSACSSARSAPSHVLTALGRSPELARASLRFGLGRGTTPAEIEQIGNCVVDTVRSLRQANPTALSSKA
ncbi:cysteine desulfurase family protein [Synechococcus sp. PCC 7336]|uniref:cysteine desulfurase family protein n=1 Tax=Synechococcus sp. PCC 7336 TaxID=195250 RepID=UPI0003489FAF|nr:aminotransferase class V-fold PLP-dependent enzyme [Synechococcus sp. PCC 7336]